MTEEEQRKLRAHYVALSDLQRLFLNASNTRTGSIYTGALDQVREEISRIDADFSGVVPEFDPGRDVYRAQGMCHASGVSAYLARAVAQLKVRIEDSESTPATQTKEFTFVQDAELRKILERDYLEMQRALLVHCSKSVIVLAGSAVEAMLLDALLAREDSAKASSKAPKDDPDITHWGLVYLINVAVDLELVDAGASKLSHPLREYRDLVHPGNEIRNKLRFDAEEARIALNVVDIVHRGLSSTLR